MKKLLFLFVALVATTTLWASNTITYTATEKLPETTDEWSVGLHTNAFNVEIISHEFSNGVGTITFAGEVTTIGWHAFYSCSDLTSIVIPNSVTTVEVAAVLWCEGLISIDVDAANTHYCSIDGVLFNYAKDTLIQYPAANTRTEYTIPNSVTTIEYSAFAYCGSLTSIVIPNSVTTIGINAFAECRGLTSITIPNSVTTIGGSAFSGCTSLPIIDNLRYADTYLVGIVEELSTYTIKEGTKWIGDRAFAFSGVTSVTIPNSVTTIGEDAFYKCSSLTSVTIGNSVTEIGRMAFSDCINLTSIAIPNSVITIGDYAFQSCSSLTSVAIGNSVKTIGERAFLLCNALVSIDVDAANTHYCSIDGVLFNYAKDTLILYPAANTRTEYTIPNSVTTIWYNAFRECSSLTSVTIPNSVITIGELAFFYGTSLTSITVHWTDVNKLPTMGDDVFVGIANWAGPSYATLHVPEGTKNIYKNADQWKEFGTITDKQYDPKNYIITYTATEQLTNLYLEVGWATFGPAIISHTFSNGTGTITCDGEITKIGDMAFAFSGLTSINIPNSVTTIEEMAFYNCANLTSITIPTSVTTIGEGAFEYCYGLTSVTIPNSVTTIGEGTFRECTGLTSVTIGNSVTTIGDYAFSGCSGLTSVTIGNSVTTIGNRAFAFCSGLTKTNYTGTIADWCKIEFENYSSNPIYYSHNFFINDEEVKALIIPEGVDTIGEAAFYECSGLTSVTIGNSVTTIGDDAFYGCSGLTSVTIPNSVTTIGDYAFSGCTGLTSVTIPNSVTTIGYAAFADCSGLTSINVDAANTHYCSVDGVLFNYAKDTIIQYPANNSKTTYTIPNSVTTIGFAAFAYCSGLTSVTIPNSVTTIGFAAFAYCSGLTSITIPSSVTTIGESAFDNCTSLTSITIPNSVTTIGDDAFYLVNNIVYNGTATGSPWGAKCVNGYVDGYLVYTDASKTILCGCSSAAIGEIFIPNSVTTIGESAFEGCSGLTSISIPNSVTTIGEWAFADCSGLTSVTIPNSATTIGEWAFAYCSGLTSVTIPNSVTTIGDYAFAGCSGLTSVTIPNSVTTIGDYAFYWCEVLTSITCYAITPPECGNGVFKYISQDAKVYVPASALADYQNAEVWKDLQLCPIAADVTPMDDENPIVTPTDQDVTITWAITDGADTYTLTITAGGEVFCVMTFNAEGQMINIAFKAPAIDGAHQAPAATLTAQGYQFTVTGLNPGTAYDYSVTATDASGQTLAEHKGNFSTTGGGTPTPINEVHGSQSTTLKFFHNGNLIIERNGVKYTATGQKVR